MADPPVVLSVEQALALPYGTLRFVHLGWRVIRIEATPRPGLPPGDPNRYIGRPVAGADRHSYYIAPNAGKEAMALDLKDAAGQAVLRRLISELDVDIFCTNTIPARHRSLGIDYETLRAAKADLIWCSISAQGTTYPDVSGYDPVTQAQCGFMDLTGAPDGPPLQCGPPLTDLKAGDEMFAQVMLALWERDRTGNGKMIDVSLAHGAVSWLHTFTPLLDMGSTPDELRRNGNKHRQFFPVNAYRTGDGYVYLAVGSDAQWARLVAEPMFAELDQERFATNEGRRAGQDELHALIDEVTGRHPAAAVSAALERAAVPHSPITPVEEIMELPFFAESALHTITPEGRRVRLPPPAVAVDHLEAAGRELPFPPSYGEHTDVVLGEAGFTPAQVRELRAAGTVA